MKLMDHLNQGIMASKEITENIPCNNCNGDCCGHVIFTMDELDTIFTKYQKNKEFRKRFPWKENNIGQHLTMEEAFPKSGKEVVKIDFKKKLTREKRNLQEGSCIFKSSEETGGCMIYEDRPLVCREYGKRECLRCPYTGLDSQPKDLEVRKQLVNEGHYYRNNQLLIEQQAYLKFKI